MEICTCGGPLISDRVRGEKFCNWCFLVADELLLSKDELVTSDGRGPPIHDNNTFSMTTHFGGAVDGTGKLLDGQTQHRMRYLSLIDSRGLKQKERATRHLRALVYAACSRLQVASMVRDRALEFAKKTYDAGLLRGQEFTVLVAASILLAAREKNVYLAQKDLLASVNIVRKQPMKQVRRVYAIVRRANGVVDASVAPDTVLALAVERLRVRGDILREARRLLALMSEQTGHPARVRAAAALYMAAKRCGFHLAQEEVARVCDTTDVSLRKRLPSLRTFIADRPQEDTEDGRTN